MQLLRVLQLSDEEHREHLLFLNELGDSTPTELMENILALLVQVLLTPVRTPLASSSLVHTKDYHGLVEETDRILLGLPSKRCGCGV